MKKLSVILFWLLLPIMVFGSVFGIRPLTDLKLNPNFLRESTYVPESVNTFTKEIGDTEWYPSSECTFDYLPYHGGRPQLDHLFISVEPGGDEPMPINGYFDYNASRLCTEFEIYGGLGEIYSVWFVGTVEYDDYDRLTKFEAQMDYWLTDGLLRELRIDIEYPSNTDMEISVFIQKYSEVEYQKVQIELDSQNRIQRQNIRFSYNNSYWRDGTEYIFSYHDQDTSTIEDFIRYISDNIVMLIFTGGEMMYGMVTEVAETHWWNDDPMTDCKYIYDYDSDLMRTEKIHYQRCFDPDIASIPGWINYYRNTYAYDDHGNMIEELGEAFHEGEFIDDFLMETSYMTLTDNHDLSAPAISPINISVYPQPFAGNVNILGESKAGGEIKMEIFNLRGQKVRSFNMPSGAKLTWDGKDESGKDLPASVYFLRAGQGSDFRTKKLIKIR